VTSQVTAFCKMKSIMQVLGSSDRMDEFFFLILSTAEVISMFSVFSQFIDSSAKQINTKIFINMV
jgi:hypothetical protein